MWPYLSVINLAGTEKCFHRKVSWNRESRKVHKELASDIEEDQEEVDSDEAEESVNFGDRGLLLQVVKDRILR